MLTSLPIRAADANDVDNIRHCAQLAYHPYVSRMKKKPAPMLADFEQLVAQEFVSVAVDGDTVAGYVVCYPQDDSLHLENVAVLPTYSGRGIGKSLINYAEHKALSLGVRRIELYTNELMHENLAMYPHLGYTEAERKTQDGFNRVFFTKQLD